MKASGSRLMALLREPLGHDPDTAIDGLIAKAGVAPIGKKGKRRRFLGYDRVLAARSTRQRLQARLASLSNDDQPARVLQHKGGRHGLERVDVQGKT